MAQLGWVNTMHGYVAPGFTSALGTFLLQQFFKSLPNELAEAVKIDGSGPFRTFFSIVLPLARRRQHPREVSSNGMLIGPRGAD